MAAARRERVRSFEEVYDEAVQRAGRPALLLGNGFSIAADSSFDYRRLLDIARFGHPLTNRRVREVFDTMSTADFEMVVRRLESAAEVLDIYKTVSRTSARIQRDARVLTSLRVV